MVIISINFNNDPLSSESLMNQLTFMNSDSQFNEIAHGKPILTLEEVVNETVRVLRLGAKYYYINKEDELIGMLHYLERNPSDEHTWIGLFIIHIDHQRSGAGAKALQILETQLINQNITKIRLCVQHGNNKGAAFWEKHGYLKIKTSIDEHNNPIDIREKVW